MLLTACLLLLQSAAGYGQSAAGDGQSAAPDRQSSLGDMAGWLEKLRSPGAAERASAQQWLARHLTLSDLDLVRAAAREGDAETRRRLSVAIADDDAHVALAVSLASDGDPETAEIGRGALTERLARWCPAWTRRGLDRAAALQKLAGRSDLKVAIDSRTKDRRLDVALDALARFGPGALPLVLDPDLALSDHPRDPPADPLGVIEGTFERVLEELVRLHRADLEGFALESDSDAEAGGDVGFDFDGPVRPWIRIRRSLVSESRSGADRIVDWCVEVARAADPARRSACARALAATGWPGAIAWLEQRAFATKDQAAFDGILLAAGRGQVAPSLARPDVLSELLGSLPEDLQGPQRDLVRADGIARAIAAAGPFGTGDQDLAAIVVQDLPRLPPREQWLRLVALEGMRSPSLAAAAGVESLLAAPGVPPPVRFQALRARAAMRPGAGASLSVEDPSAVLAWADRAGKGVECVHLLVALGIGPPALRADSKDDGSRPGSLRLEELEWCLFTADGSGAAPRLLALALPIEEGGLGLAALALRTRAWVRRGAASRFDGAIAAARALPGADAERLERLQVLSGAGSEELGARWIARLAEASPTRQNPLTREDLLCLAALAAAPDGASARAALVRSLASGVNLDDTVAALELAEDVLRASRREEEERAFVRAVSDTARDGSKEVRSRFHPDLWPLRTTPEAIRANDRDRSLDRSGL